MSKEQPIILAMICKNEAKVIRRCLESVKDYIDGFSIQDSMSVDGTRDIINEVLDGIHGSIDATSPWVNFSYNRNQVQRDAQRRAGKFGYILWMDADDTFVPLDPEKPGLPELYLDAYHVSMELRQFKYTLPRLVKADYSWTWLGVVHECLVLDTKLSGEPDFVPLTEGPLTTHKIVSYGDGVRAGDPKKFSLAAAELERALVDEPNNSRYQYYLACSYRDARYPERARYHFANRARQGGYVEEIFSSLLMIAEIDRVLNVEPEKVICGYLKAWSFRPQRSEPLVYLSKYLTEHGMTELGQMFMEKAQSIPYPVIDSLFIDNNCYGDALKEMSKGIKAPIGAGAGGALK